MSKFIVPKLFFDINYSLYSWQEILLFMVSLWLLPLIHILLKITNVEITYRFLKLLSPQPTKLNPDVNKAQKIKEIAELVAQVCPRWAKCLRKSFLLWYLLRINHINSNLVIGVRQQDHLFQSHAWIEFNGNPLNETKETAKTYKVLVVK